MALCSRLPPVVLNESSIATERTGAAAGTFHVEHRSRDPVVPRTRHTAEACRRGYRRSSCSGSKPCPPSVQRRADAAHEDRRCDGSLDTPRREARSTPPCGCPASATERSARGGEIDMLASCDDGHHEGFRSARAVRAGRDLRSSLLPAAQAHTRCAGHGCGGARVRRGTRVDRSSRSRGG